MGKIRIKQMGVPKLEKAQKEEVKRRREAKKLKKLKKKIRAPGLKGGERVVAVGPSEEEIEKLEIKKLEKKEKPKEKAAVKVVKKRPGRSKRYKQVTKLVDKTKAYPIKQAIGLLRKVSLARFNGTVEAHINVKEKGFSGEVLLPHGTGKKIKVAIADTKVLAQIEKGKIDFDVLLATPQMMPKLAKFGKVLGPRGLMPNPKAGTLIQEPEKKAEEITKGRVYLKTERDAPIIHLSFGKMDFKDTQLIENFNTLIQVIGSNKIKKVVIKSTISPGIKVEFDKQ